MSLASIDSTPSYFVFQSKRIFLNVCTNYFYTPLLERKMDNTWQENYLHAIRNQYSHWFQMIQLYKRKTFYVYERCRRFIFGSSWVSSKGQSSNSSKISKMTCWKYTIEFSLGGYEAGRGPTNPKDDLFITNLIRFIIQIIRIGDIFHFGISTMSTS